LLNMQICDVLVLLSPLRLLKLANIGGNHQNEAVTGSEMERQNNPTL